MTIPNNIPLIAAGSALAGVLISQAISILLSIFDKKHQKQILLRQKYELMMFEFQDSLKYVQEVHSCTSLDQLNQRAGSPHTGKAVGLSQLYFPGLVEPLEVYYKSQISFFNSVISLYDTNISANASAQCVMIKSHRDVIDQLLKDKELVMDALLSNVEKYTKA